MGEDALRDVVGQELAGVVAAQAERHLRQVVRAEREEVRGAGDFVGAQRGTRHLDHRADQIVRRGALGGDDLGADVRHALAQNLQFPFVADQRDHDLRQHGQAGARQLARGFHDGRDLGLVDLREGDAQPAAAVAQHRVQLVQDVALRAQPIDRKAELRRQGFQVGVGLRQKFVQRRVEQPNGDRQPLHGTENPDEVGLLHGQNLAQRAHAGVGIVGQNHLADRVDAVALEEHVLGPTQADALGTERARDLGVVRRVRVGPDAQTARAVGPGHQRLEGRALHARFDRRNAARKDLAGRAVQGNRIAGAQHERPAAHLQFLAGIIDLQSFAADHRALAHAAAHQRGVRAGPAPRGQNALRGVHAVDVFRGGFDADQHDRPAGGGREFRVLGREHDLAAHRAGRRGQPARNRFAGRVGIENGVQKLVELGGRHAQRGLFFGDAALIDHIDRDLDRGRGRPLGGAGLQHPQMAVLRGELDVLRVAIVRFQSLGDGFELVEAVRHLFLECRIACLAFVLGTALALRPLAGGRQRDLLRRADPGDHVLALGIDQEIAVQFADPGRQVAGERHARGAAVAQVAEYHGLDRDRGAPLVRNAFDAAIRHGPRVVPGAEDRADRPPELVMGVVGKRNPLPLLNEALEDGDEFPQVVRGKLDVGRDAFGRLFFLDDPLERVALRLGLRFEPEHDVAVHLHEPAIAVVREPRIAGLLDEPLDGLVVQPQVQDRVHHARHGHLGARANR